jgi:hypothetical protein
VLVFFLQLNSPQMTRALRSPTDSNGKIQFSFSFYDPLVLMIYTLLYIELASNPFIRLHTLRFKCFSVRRDRIKEARIYIGFIALFTAHSLSTRPIISISWLRLRIFYSPRSFVLRVMSNYSSRKVHLSMRARR